jgi:hypothetical protein
MLLGAASRHALGLISPANRRERWLMRYLLAFLLPPFAILSCKKPVQFVLNLVVWLISIPLIFFMGVGLIGWLLCTAHALIVCNFKRQELQLNRIVGAIEARNQASADPAKS